MNLENIYKGYSFKESDDVILFSDNNFEFELGKFRAMKLKRKRAIELTGNEKNLKITMATPENLDIIKRLKFVHSK